MCCARETILVEEYAVSRREWRFLFAPEGRATAEQGLPAGAVEWDFADMEREIGGVVLDQIPGVCAQLVLHLVEESEWPEQPHAPLAAQADAKQPIEADEMIHVGMGNENIAHTQNLARGKGFQIAQIE